MIKYYIKAFYADSYLDDYKKGESAAPSSSWGLTDLFLNTRPEFDSPSEALKYILSKNGFSEYWMQFWTRDDINAAASDEHLAEFWNNITVDENNGEILNALTLEEWRGGLRKLWACHLHVTLGKVNIEKMEFKQDEY